MELVGATQRIRPTPDGKGLWIPRADGVTELLLDKKYPRLKGPKELKWAVIESGNELWANQFINQYHGRRAILFGKGPSLDRFDFSQFPTSGVVSACLNETVHLVPSPQYVFFVDAHVGQGMRLPNHCSAVVPPAIQHLPLCKSELNQRRILFHWTPEWVVPGYATAAIALAILAMWGIRDVTLVGFDGYDGNHSPDGKKVYAERLQPHVTRPRADSDYGPINRQIEQVLTKFYDRFSFWHRSN